MTREQMDALKAQLHPSIREHFVYLPNPRAASPEEVEAAFPGIRSQKSQVVHMWLAARRRQAESDPA